MVIIAIVVVVQGGRTVPQFVVVVVGGIERRAVVGSTVPFIIQGEFGVCEAGGTPVPHGEFPASRLDGPGPKGPLLLHRGETTTEYGPRVRRAVVVPLLSP